MTTLSMIHDASLLMDVSAKMKKQKEDAARYTRYTEKQMKMLWELVAFPHSVYTVPLAEQIRAQTILYTIGGYDEPFLVITHQEVRRWYATWTSHSSISIMECPVYTFAQPLGQSEMDMLDQIVPPMTPPWIPSPLVLPANDVLTQKRLRILETMIRRIPGSYQHGAWKQLHGFFGMYYNEETKEGSAYPPEIHRAS